MTDKFAKHGNRRLPRHGWVGILLMVVFWILNWTLPGLRTQWGFFGLWLGYSLTVDALVYLRKGHSLLTRSRREYAALFVISVPGWWLFEVINQRTANWSYVGREYFTDLEFQLWASLCFSTVIPAVLGTAELVGTFGWLKKMKSGPALKPVSRTLVIMLFSGLIMMGLMLVWPRYFFPFVWLSVFFILEPVNVWLGNRSLTKWTAAGDWRPVAALFVGGLTCGFFWEMWNFYSYPKWVYHVPFVDFAHIFEMPLLGYLGYLPFSLELFALYHLVVGLAGKGKEWDYIQIAASKN